ncbi:flagellar hook-length control protein FliK [Pseudoroseomonas wenyumeiae]
MLSRRQRTGWKASRLICGRRNWAGRAAADLHDGTVQVSMAAERGDTFEALRQDRVHLEQQMQQAGLQLSSGGLDLQHGHLPREAPEPPATLPAPTEGAAAAEDEAPPSRRPPSDSLIDLIA